MIFNNYSKFVRCSIFSFYSKIQTNNSIHSSILDNWHITQSVLKSLNRLETRFVIYFVCLLSRFCQCICTEPQSRSLCIVKLWYQRHAMAQLGCQNEFAPDNLSLREWTALNNQMNVKWNENVHSSGLKLIIFLLSFSMRSVGEISRFAASQTRIISINRGNLLGFLARQFTSQQLRSWI